jgi:hypothetical protein
VAQRGIQNRRGKAWEFDWDTIRFTIRNGNRKKNRNRKGAKTAAPGVES